MFRIHYTLKEPERIVPWGEEVKYLHWFGLTDGLLWIRAGDSVIYEYKEPHPDLFGESVSYVDYQLSRFIEDFLELTPVLSESVPEALYKVVDNLPEDFRALKARYTDKSDDEFWAFYDEFYGPLTEWLRSRFLSSGHLICGPSIGFVRCGDKLKMIWDSDPLEDGSEMWKYPRGVFELDYPSFVSEVSRFLNAFTTDMDRQVSEVVRNGIPGVYVDADALVRENARRKQTFEHLLKSLYSEDTPRTDWNKILDLYALMRRELGKA